MKKITLLLAGLIFILNGNVSAQNPLHSNYVLKGEKQLFRGKLPRVYKFYGLNWSFLDRKLKDLPDYKSSTSSGVFLELPYNIQGKTDVFEMYTYQVMDEELQSKYKEIKTFLGKSKNGRTLYLVKTPEMVSMVILNPASSTFQIQPYNESTWIAFSTEDDWFEGDYFCGFDEAQQNFEKSARIMSSLPQSDGILREYRMAVAATAFYSNYHLSRHGIPDSAPDATKKSVVLSEIIRALVRLNSVFERDLSVHFNLVANNDRLIFLDTATDPQRNHNLRPKQVIDSVIGPGNYDLGHTWDTISRGYYGRALYPVCFPGASFCKGDAVERDRFIIKVVAHETGHNFGAMHTFSYNCGYYTNSVEAGAGATIMSYVGGCRHIPNANYKKNAYDRFNFKSIKEMYNRTLNSSSDCSTRTPISHSTPSISSISDKYIPKLTPFRLPAFGSDPDGDVLTYVWDEEDSAPYWLDSISSTNRQGPLFRTFDATRSHYRYFPNIDSLVLANKTSTKWEKLPAVERDIHFNVTVKDNHPGEGQFANEEVTLHVDTTAGPFRITNILTDETWYPGDSRTITWDVANTDNALVNCQYVDIYFSADGGYHLTNLLADHVPNTGSYTITVPAISTPKGKIFVLAENNYFLAVSRGNIKVGDHMTTCGLDYISSPSANIPDDDLFGLTDTINVPDNFIIEDLNVTVDISHADVGELNIWLISPEGISSLMYFGNCHNNRLQMTFDEETSNYLRCMAGDTVTSLNPFNERLTKFYQHPSAGKWVLKIRDTIPNQTGILNSWTLSFCSKGNVVKVSNETFKNVKVYPNPNSGEFMVEFPVEGIDEKVKLRLFDLTGRVVFEQVFMPEESFIRKKVKFEGGKGNYVLQILSGRKSFHTIIQKF